MDLRCYGGYHTGKRKKEYDYEKFNKMWDDRFNYLVTNCPASAKVLRTAESE
ncbi:hypothetical protein A2U01_0071966, partial [Trifolium medium]|nr:hypothetical protein [Trifolium medium]